MKSVVLSLIIALTIGGNAIQKTVEDSYSNESICRFAYDDSTSRNRTSYLLELKKSGLLVVSYGIFQLHLMPNEKSFYDPFIDPPLQMITLDRIDGSEKKQLTGTEFDRAKELMESAYESEIPGFVHRGLLANGHQQNMMIEIKDKVSLYHADGFEFDFIYDEHGKFLGTDDRSGSIVVDERMIDLMEELFRLSPIEINLDEWKL